MTNSLFVRYFSLAKNKDGGRRPPREEDNITKINFGLFK